MSMLCSGSWRGQDFKEYNFNALGQPTNGGYLHPLLKVGVHNGPLEVQLCPRACPALSLPLTSACCGVLDGLLAYIRLLLFADNLPLAAIVDLLY